MRQCDVGAVRRLGALALAALMWTTGGTARASQTPDDAKPTPAALVLGEPVTVEVVGASSRAYAVRLSAGEYVNVTIEHADLCAPPTLIAPDRSTILTARDAPSSLGGRARVEYVAEADGEYELVVTLIRQAQGARRSVTIEEEALRPATEVDRKRAATYRLLADGGEVPGSARTPEARRKAEEKLVAARDAYRALGDIERELNATSQIAAVCSASGRPQDAARTLGEGASTARSRGDALLLPLLLNLSRVDLELGDASALDAALDEATDLVRTKGGDDLAEWAVDMTRGDSRRRRGDLRGARELFERANALGERIGLGPGSVDVEIAWLEIDEGRLVEALADFQSLAASGESRGELVLVRRSLMASSQILGIFGDLQESIAAAERGLVFARATSSGFGESFLLAQLGYVRLELFDFDEAVHYFDEALRIARAGGYAQLVANAEIGLGRAHLVRGEAREALAAFDDAVSVIEATGFSEGLAVSLTGVGNAYASLGDATRSAAAFERALDVVDSRGKLIDREVVRLAVGDALAGRATARARTVLEQALEMSRSLQDRRGVAAALFQLARIDRDAGRLEPAKAGVREAVGIVETIRSGIKSPELRTSYFAKIRAYYDLYTDVLMREGAPASVAEAFAVAERGRGRVLLETLTERGVDLAAGVDGRLRVEERAARQRLVDRLDYQVRLLGREHTAEEAAATAREVAASEGRLADVEGRLRATSPAYAAITSPEPVTADTVRREVLDDRTALVAYTLGEDTGYAWAVTTEGVTSASLPGRREVEARVRRLRDAVAARACSAKNEATDEREARVKAADAAYAAEARALGETVLGPLAKAVAGKRLAIVPDGALALVPFGALVEPGTGRYVIAGHEVVTLPSVSALAAIRQQAAKRATPTGAVAVVADPVFDATDERVTTAKWDAAPKADEAVAANVALRAAGATRGDPCGERVGLERLRGSAREADAIAAMAPKGSRLEATGFDANLDLATSGELGKYKVVHFATHGYVPAEAPELSGLVLSLVDRDGRERQGYLGMPQIYAMRLPVETVVLSACETGLGREASGEGVIGLVRGFMYAGSSRVVSSLWKIDDEGTAGLMEAFYEGMLKRGRTPAAALREAQLKMIAEREPAYVWGAFQLAGEWR